MAWGKTFWQLSEKSHWLPFIISLWPSDTIWQHRSGSTLAQVMACCLMAPSHHLTQWWLLICEIFLHSPESNFTVCAQATIQYYKFENSVFLRLLPHLRGVNELISCGLLTLYGDIELGPYWWYSISQEICTRFCCALLCCGYAIVHNEFTWSIYPYSSGLLCWHWGNR